MRKILLTICAVAMIVSSLSACSSVANLSTNTNSSNANSPIATLNTTVSTPVPVVNNANAQPPVQPVPTVPIVTGSNTSGNTSSKSNVSNTAGGAAVQQYNEFMSKADAIEAYDDSHLQTAMTQTDLNIESSTVYNKWDALLNEVYQYLKANMSSSEFETLKNDEIRWIKEKEAAMEAAEAEYKGGSIVPLAVNSAGIEYTRERCYYLISLVK